MNQNYRAPMKLLNDQIRVLLIGAGGTGSHLNRELIQLDTCLRQLNHKGLHVTIADGGVVTNANLSRQHFLPTQTGMNKAEAQVFIANNLYGRNFTAIPRQINPEDIGYKDFDILITAVDKPSVRFGIHQHRPTTGNVLWLDTGNDHTSGNIVLGHWCRTPQIPSICDLYDYSLLSDGDSEIKSCSSAESIGRQTLGVNATSARLAAQLLWNLVRNGEIDVHGAHFDTTTLESFPIHCNTKTWGMYGWSKTAA